MDKVEQVLKELGLKRDNKYDLKKDIIDKGATILGYGNKTEKYGYKGVTLTVYIEKEQGKVTLCDAKITNVETKCASKPASLSA